MEEGPPRGTPRVSVSDRGGHQESRLRLRPWVACPGCTGSPLPRGSGCVPSGRGPCRSGKGTRDRCPRRLPRPASPGRVVAVAPGDAAETSPGACIHTGVRGVGCPEPKTEVRSRLRFADIPYRRSQSPRGTLPETGSRTRGAPGVPPTAPRLCPGRERGPSVQGPVPPQTQSPTRVPQTQSQGARSRPTAPRCAPEELRHQTGSLASTSCIVSGASLSAHATQPLRSGPKVRERDTQCTLCGVTVVTRPCCRVS